MCSRDFSTAMCWKWLISAGLGQREDPADAGLGVGVGDLAVGEQLDLLELLLDGHLAPAAGRPSGRSSRRAVTRSEVSAAAFWRGCRRRAAEVGGHHAAADDRRGQHRRTRPW